MGNSGTDRVPETSLWLPTCKVIALLLARSVRPGGLSASDTSRAGTRLHRLNGSIGAGQAPGQRLCRPPGLSPRLTEGSTCALCCLESGLSTGDSLPSDTSLARVRSQRTDLVSLFATAESSPSGLTH